MISLNALYFCLLCIVLLSHSLGEDQSSGSNGNQTFQHPLTDMPGPSDDVVTSYFFPAHPDQKIPIGETVSMLCHFANDGMIIYLLLITVSTSY